MCTTRLTNNNHNYDAKNKHQCQNPFQPNDREKWIKNGVWVWDRILWNILNKDYASSVYHLPLTCSVTYLWIFQVLTSHRI
jgi:hypothetical protein